MNELKRVLEAAAQARRQDEDVLLATVVRVQGSTYRRPGARMLLTGAGWAAGSISGGCLEGDVVKRAWWYTEAGPRLITYDSMAEDDDIAWGFGLGCNGIIDVLLERVTPGSGAQAALDFVERCLAHRVPGVLATVIEARLAPVSVGDRWMIGEGGSGGALPALAGEWIVRDGRQALENACSAQRSYDLPHGGRVAVFFEYIAPPLPLVVPGAGHDALPLVRLAKEHLGWHVSVVDTRSTRVRPHRFPLADVVLACPASEAIEHLRPDHCTAFVVMTHNYADDRELLRQLLPAPHLYLGVLGPRRRTERLLTDLADRGLPSASLLNPSLHAPVGLDIGADNPDEIALSVISEIQAVIAGREGGPLRNRATSIHPHFDHRAAAASSGWEESEVTACPRAGA